MANDASYDVAGAEAALGTEGTDGAAAPDTLDQPAGDATDTAGQSATPAWDGTQWKMKFRDKEVMPQTREQLQTWAQQGYAYSQRAAELKSREGELNQMQEKLGPYQKLADAFDANPELRTQIMKLYNDTINGISSAKQAGDSQGAEAGSDVLAQMQKMLEPVQQKLASFDEFQNASAAKSADDELKGEQSKLQEKFPNNDWSTEDSEGHTLGWRILKTAYDEGITSLEKAYKLYMYDHVAESAAADALKKQADRIQSDKQKGIVQSGGVTPAPKQAGPNVGAMNWNQVAEAAIKEMR